MKLLMLFALFACSPLAWGLMPSRIQIAAGPMNRVIRPDTPANQRLLTAIEAGDLPGVQAALQSGASADAEAGWAIPAMDVPPSPAQPFGASSSFTDLAVEDSTGQRDKYLPIFRLLLHHIPASSFARPEAKVSLMCSAVMMNDLESVRWLVARGVSINPPASGAGILSLELSCSDTRVKTVSPLMAFLLDHGAEVNTVDLEGGTPLMWAAEYGQNGVVQALLAHGADPALQDKRGWTALDWAAQRDQSAAASLLRSRTPIRIGDAARLGDMIRLQTCLDLGDDPNQPDDSGATPLMQAAQAACLPAARLLLERGASVRRTRKDGMTALHLAAASGCAPLVALLLDHGADSNAVARNGATALSLAGKGNFGRVLAALRLADARR